jgi:hypothetical protein
MGTMVRAGAARKPGAAGPGDLQALRRVPTRFFGVFMNLNPVFAALTGLAVLGQSRKVVDWLAMACRHPHGQRDCRRHPPHRSPVSSLTPAGGLLQLLDALRGVGLGQRLGRLLARFVGQSLQVRTLRRRLRLVARLPVVRILDRTIVFAHGFELPAFPANEHREPARLGRGPWDTMKP